jgi:hypothetical protein
MGLILLSQGVDNSTDFFNNDFWFILVNHMN